MDVAKIFAAIFSARLCVAVFFAGVLCAVAGKWSSVFQDAVQYPTSHAVVWVVLISGVFTMSYPVEWLAKFGKRSWGEYSRKRRRMGRLSRLSIDEQHVLGKYLNENRTVNIWNRGGGVVDVLARDGILKFVVGVEGGAKPVDRYEFDQYEIDPTVWEYLKQHPELVDCERNPERTGRADGESDRP